MFPPELDRMAPLALNAQIADYYAAAISAGRLRAGDRLPPIRDLAQRCDVTRATVQGAYRHLAERGLVESTVGRGTTVVGRPEAEAGTATAMAEGVGSGLRLGPFADAALRRMQVMLGAPFLARGRDLVANFAELAPDTERFPVDDWRAAMDAVLRRRGPELLGYGMSANGLPELREQFAERARSLDPDVTAKDVLVTGGAQQAFDLALRTFCAPGDAVVVTDPSYHQMSGLLHAHGLESVTVPLGAEGLDLDRLGRVLERTNVRLVYLMPTFHNPTGFTLGLRQRRALVDVVARTQVPIVEDEYQLSLRFRGEPLPSLRSMDERGLTITVATASKELFPALRIGWVIAAPEVLRSMAAVKRFMDLETSPLLQAGLVEFIACGAMDRYLAALRDELCRRHGALAQACSRHLPDGCEITEPDGGFVAWLSMPQPGQADRLAEMASERGVLVVPGRAFDPHDRPSTGVRLCLTRANCDQIATGIEVLGECARDVLTDSITNRPFL